MTEAFDLPPASEAAQRDFFDAMAARTETALAASGVISHWLDIAGVILRLNFAGPALRDAFLPALAHLEVAGTAADAMFNIWDSASTGVNVPPPPCARNQFTDRGDIWGFESTEILSAFHWVECSVALLDTSARTGIYWVDDAAALPYWCKASPLRTLLHWLMQLSGKQLLHAAVVGTDAGGIVITGKGGIGKSTTALLCLEAGMNYIGDDYVIIGLLPEPRAYRLYGTAKLNPDQAAHFPRLNAAQVMFPPGSHVTAVPDKTVFQLHPGWAGQMPAYLKLMAIVMPVISPQHDSDFIPAEQHTILRSASFTTLSHLPHAGSATHEFIAKLCAALPRYLLRLGDDFSKIPMAVREFIDSPGNYTAVAADPIGAPLISVIIPAYNGTRFLGHAVASILAQNYPALDMIIIDDGSPEDVPARVAKLDVDVRYFRQENAGPGAARNRGIREATGEYLAFLDIDDEWPAGNLLQMLRILQSNPALDVVTGHGQLMRGDGVADSHFIGNAAESFPYAIGAALFRRRAFSRNGLFDESLRYGEDTDWFRRAEERRLGVERLPETTLLVRRHEANMTRGKSLVELNALKVFKKMLDRQRP